MGTRREQVEAWVVLGAMTLVFVVGMVALWGYLFGK